MKKQTLLKEIEKLEQNKKTADKQLQELSSKVRNMLGIILSRQKLEHIKPETGMMGTIKNISLEDIENLKKTATEFHVINEKLENLSTKYINLKSKVPTIEDKKEHGKQLHKLEQLEKENDELLGTLKAADISLDISKKTEKSKEQEI